MRYQPLFIWTGIILFFLSCNPVKIKYSLIYIDKGENKAIAHQIKELLESEYYNVELELIEGSNSHEIVDNLVHNIYDLGLIENYIDYQPDINSALFVNPEILHIFYKKGRTVASFSDLVYESKLFIEEKNKPLNNLIFDIFDFYGLDRNRIDITSDYHEAETFIVLSGLLTKEEMERYKNFQLFSFDESENIEKGSIVEGISLKYPRTSPFLIPAGTYTNISPEPIVTLSIDMLIVVRKGMGVSAVNDFTETVVQNRQKFFSINPLFSKGLQLDFDKSKLDIPLHKGAKIYLDGDRPSFMERYAELGGVILSILIAFTSGLVSLTKWRVQKKKDRIDEFYIDLLQIKNNIVKFKTSKEILKHIHHIQVSQNKAFEKLIDEKILANESFRIYMELSKETINDLKSKLKFIVAQHQKST